MAKDKSFLTRARTLFIVRIVHPARHVIYLTLAHVLAKLGYCKSQYVNHSAVGTSEPEGDKETIVLLQDAAEQARKDTKNKRPIRYLQGAAITHETHAEWLYNWLMRGIKINLSKKKFRTAKLSYWPVNVSPIRQQYPASWAYDPANPDKYDESELLSDPSIKEDLDVIHGKQS